MAALPRIDTALTQGEISWTKARLLCRVATPETERMWLDTAAQMSAQALAREVRAADARALESGGAPQSGAAVDGAASDEEGEGFDATLDHVLEEWGRHRVKWKRHRVFERDGWRCAVPGCTSYRNLQDHHIAFRSSAGRSDELENRTTLCAWHHLRGGRAGIVRCDGKAPGGLRFGFGGVE